MHLVSQAWQTANLEYKLKDVQRHMRARIHESEHFKYFIKCARRLGKSYLLCLLAIEQCLRKPGAIVRYGAPTAKALKKIVKPIMRLILADCPSMLLPQWKGGDGLYLFPNESEIHIAGLNMHPDDLRGTACDLFIIDEGSVVNDLDYIVHDVAMPQFMDPDGNVVKGRRLLVAGTPPRTPAHEFTEMSRVAETEGWLSHYNIYDAGYPEETVNLFKKESGGENSSTWNREYMALDVVDENVQLVPEWKPEYEIEPHVDEFFKFYLKYDSLDIGVRDKTVCIFAHYDFKQSILYVHDEFVINGPDMTTEKVAAGIKAGEKANFWNAEREKMHSIDKRISDVDLLLIQDLSHLHRLPFQATDKGKLEEMLNELRIWVNNGRIRVNPKCTQTIGCLKYGVWDEKRRQWERTKAYGHFDALAALMYLVRNVNTRHNPIPANYGKPEADYFFPEEQKTRSDKLRKAFGVRPKGKTDKLRPRKRSLRRH